jgi:parallel beta-helix repeat protein
LLQKAVLFGEQPVLQGELITTFTLRILVTNVSRGTSIPLIILLVLSFIFVSFGVQSARADTPIYIKADGSIQPSTSNITTVDNVLYTFTGNNSNRLVVEKDNIAINGMGYTLQGTGSNGIALYHRHNVTITNMTITQFTFGIALEDSTNNLIAANNIFRIGDLGIFFKSSSNNTVICNNLTENGFRAVHLEGDSNYNVIVGNRLENGADTGVRILHSSNNTLAGNTLLSVCSLYLWDAKDNQIYHNNFVSTQLLYYAATGDNIGNVWDNGYASGGNYWGNYSGKDANNDGVGDTPYIIPTVGIGYSLNFTGSNNIDQYPLISPFNISTITVQLPNYAISPISNPMPTHSPSPTPTSTPIETTQQDNSSWVSKASMQTARGHLGVVALNGEIYAIGGDHLYLSGNCLSAYGAYGSVLNATEEYNPKTDTWITKADMHTPRCSFAVAVYENKIYCIGGYAGNGNYTGVNEVYDPATNTWASKAPMPTARAGLQANVVDGKIYLIGGRSASLEDYLPINEVYDPSTDSWTTKTPSPNRLTSGACAEVDGKIYFLATISHLDLGPFIQIYDPAVDQWSKGPSAPTYGGETAIAAATSGAYAHERIYFFDESSTNAYDTVSGTWLTGAPMRLSRGWAGVAVIDDIFYVVGGLPAPFVGYIVITASTTANEQYTPIGYGTIDSTEHQIPTASPSPSVSPSLLPTQVSTSSLTPSPIAVDVPSNSSLTGPSSTVSPSTTILTLPTVQQSTSPSQLPMVSLTLSDGLIGIIIVVFIVSVILLVIVFWKRQKRLR